MAQVRQVLRTALIGGGASRERIARAQSIHERTLNRRLKIRGTTLKAQVEEVRFGSACWLLETTRRSMSEIAAALDYAGASTFARAFSRRRRTLPAQWRVERASGRKTRKARLHRR